MLKCSFCGKAQREAGKLIDVIDRSVVMQAPVSRAAVGAGPDETGREPKLERVHALG